MSKRPCLKVDVLVVEDDPELRATVSEFLDDVGYAVAYAGNGAEAMELLDARLAPGLILLDLDMPVMSGWEFLRMRGRKPGLAKIPVVLVTSSNETPIAAKQVAGKLEKPALMQDLLRVVQEHVGKGGTPTAEPAVSTPQQQAH